MTQVWLFLGEVTLHTFISSLQLLMGAPMVMIHYYFVATWSIL